MKKMILNVGGLVLFYTVIILGVLLLNLRFTYLNRTTSTTNNYAMNN